MKKRYHVKLESKPTVTQPSEMITVVYEAEEYHDAWVGARTVCRMGTLFKDDPRCKNPDTAREFFNIATGEKVPLQAGAWTVRHIFVEGTRKRGKQRMTTLTSDQLLSALDDRNIRMSNRLREELSSILQSAEGVRVTVATARRLGLTDEMSQEEMDRETAALADPSRRSESA